MVSLLSLRLFMPILYCIILFLYSNLFPNFIKLNMSDIIFQPLLHSYINDHKDYTCIYTDRSPSHVGAAYVINNSLHSSQLHFCCSVFTAEMWVIYKAVKAISEHPHQKFVIFTDLLSALTSLQHLTPSSHLGGPWLWLPSLVSEFWFILLDTFIC